MTDARAGTRIVLDGTLSNGLRVVAVPDATAPLVEFRLSIPCAGSGDAHAARAQVLGDVLLPSADELSPERAPQWEIAGLAAGRDVNRLGVFGCIPSASLVPVLRETAAALATPRYLGQRVVESRQRVAAQVAIGRSEARWMALAALLRRWSPHQLAPCDIPPPEALPHVEPEDVRELHRNRLVPRGAVLVLVGDFAPDEIMATAERAFAEWQGAEETTLTPQPPLPGAAPGDVVLVNRPRSAQAELLLAGPAPHRTDADRPAFDLANVLFGGGVASRLSRNIREEKGYAYVAASAVEVVAGLPTTLVRVAVGAQAVAGALTETRRELGALVESPPNAAEIGHGKQLLAGRIGTAAVSPASYATFLANLLAEGADPQWADGYGERVDAVAAEDVVSAAGRYLDPAGLTAVLVGDADVLGDRLADLPDTRVHRFEELGLVTPHEYGEDAPAGAYEPVRTSPYERQQAR
ncbi:insulinase family protein [Streptomyces sp. NBC_00727]|uniref:M16 family metallopeptidase n=1 Tax=Streptomyces sp. NBC_00727 TaxID=2903675 RepID=UPI0038647480